ncbi:MAG: phosphoglycerate kinase [bacterium]|nr:phosphoglycerate kinase [bacterium]
MNIKSLNDIDVKGKRVFLRGDFNVPLNDNREITDDTRLKAALPTLRYLVDNGAKIICASHLGRPEGKKVPALSLEPVAQQLSHLLHKPVHFHNKITGKEIDKLKKKMGERDVILLQNLRFNPGEARNSETLARELAKDIDLYVNDAFGTSHREHASICKITEFVPAAAAGFLMQKELNILGMALEKPPKNYYVILGGSNLAEKVPVIRNLLDKTRKIFIGGAMAYTFMKAKGLNVGNSEVVDDALDICRVIIKEAEEKNVKLILPVDHIAAYAVEPEVTIRMIKKGEDIPDEMMGLDIGFESIHLFTKELKDAELIAWFGPLGVYEIDTFSAGTTEIARDVAHSSAVTIVGGGDSVIAIRKAGVAERITHLSDGGSASLLFLAGKKIPGLIPIVEAS